MRRSLVGHLELVNKVRLERVAALGLLVGCNSILGIGSDYHLVASSAGSGGTGANGGQPSAGGAGGKTGGASGSSSTSGGTSGQAGTNTSGGTSGDAGEAGMMGTGATTGDGGSSGAGGSTGGSSTGGSNTGGGNTGGGNTGGGNTGGGNTGGSSRGGTGGAGGSSGGTTGGMGAQGGGAGSGGAWTGITVSLDLAEQTIAGFGITNLWANDMTVAEAAALFDKDAGLGLSILEIGIDQNGTILSSPAGSWNDVTQALGYGVTIIATPVSAPANCKTNSNINDGGHLIHYDNGNTCYTDWSNTIAAFPAKLHAATGGNVYAISAQREPDFASCGSKPKCDGNYQTMLYTPDEMSKFMGFLGPKLAVLNPPVQLMTPEVHDWRHLWTNDSASGSNDPLQGAYDYGHYLHDNSNVAWSYIGIIAVHQYESQVAEPWPSGLSPIKPIWMTEMSGFVGWPEDGPSTNIQNGIAVAGWIHDALVNGNASAWFYHWFRAQITDYNEGLLWKDGTDTKRHYTFGNFSKFIRPGYARVDLSGPVPANVLLSAYLGPPPGNSVVIVAINQGTMAATPQIKLSGGGAVPTRFTPYVTSSTENIAAHTAIDATNGVLSPTLAPSSVTTLVGAF